MRRYCRFLIGPPVERLKGLPVLRELCCRLLSQKYTPDDGYELTAIGYLTGLKCTVEYKK